MSRARVALATAVAATAVSVPVVALAGGDSHRSAEIVSVCITITPKSLSVTAGPESASQSASLQRTCEVI